MQWEKMCSPDGQEFPSSFLYWHPLLHLPLLEESGKVLPQRTKADRVCKMPDLHFEAANWTPRKYVLIKQKMIFLQTKYIFMNGYLPINHSSTERQATEIRRKNSKLTNWMRLPTLTWPCLGLGAAPPHTFLGQGRCARILIIYS